MSVLDLIPTKKKKVSRITAPPPPVDVPRYKPQTFPSPHPVPARLAAKLKKLGRKFFLVRLSEKVTQCVTAAVMLLTLQMFVDWLIDIPWLVRALMLCGDLALLGYFFHKFVRPLLRPPSMEACALMVEKHWPRLRGRMIATVQFGGPRPTAARSELVHAVQQETDGRMATLNFGEIVPTRPLVRRTGAAITVVLLWCCVMVVAAPSSIALLERVFLISAKVPRKTEVICLSGNKVIPVGDSVLLEAQARGIVPSHGLATLTYDSGKVQEITIDPEPEHSDRFSLKIDSMDESMHYTIQLNDGISDTFQIKTVPRPGVTTIDCEQIYPAYTGLPDAKRMVGNLALLAGSKLKVHAVSNGKLTKAALKLVGIGKTVPLIVGGPNGDDLTGEIDIPPTGLTGFSIEITNQAGITSGDETQYPIDIIPDQPPTIQLTFPEELEVLCTLKAKPTIAFLADDDYGLAKIYLCYRIVQDQDGETDTTSATPASASPPIKKEMDLGTNLPLEMKRQYVFDLSALKPPVTEGTTIEYWMEAEDANNVTGPGKAESEHHTIKVVSEMEKKEEVMRRFSEALGATDDARDSQEKSNAHLGAVIQGKPDAPDPSENP